MGTGIFRLQFRSADSHSTRGGHNINHYLAVETGIQTVLADPVLFINLRLNMLKILIINHVCDFPVRLRCPRQSLHSNLLENPDKRGIAL